MDLNKIALRVAAMPVDFVPVNPNDINFIDEEKQGTRVLTDSDKERKASEFTVEQECENWIRDFLTSQSMACATTDELINKGHRFGYKPWLIKRVIDNLNKENYILRGRGGWCWYHGRIAKTLTSYKTFAPQNIAKEILKNLQETLNNDPLNETEITVNYHIVYGGSKGTRWEPPDPGEFDIDDADKFVWLYIPIEYLELNTTPDAIQKAMPEINHILHGKSFDFPVNSNIGQFDTIGTIKKIQWRPGSHNTQLAFLMTNLEYDGDSFTDAVWKHAEERL